MPIEFLTKENRSRYGKYYGDPNKVQLARFFHFDDSDRALVNKRRRDYNRLGFALQLSTVRFLGTFLPDPINVPDIVVKFVSRQIDIEDIVSLDRYMERKQTRYAHCVEIQQQYGYHEFNKKSWRFHLIRSLYERAWVNNERPSLMFDFATSWLVKNKVLLPGVTTLSRLISEVRDRAEKRLWKKLYMLPNDIQKSKLEEILEVRNGSRYSRFDRFRQGPVRISSPSLIDALERYKELYAFGIHEFDFTNIPPIRLKNLARHSGMGSTYSVTRMSEKRRIATLVAFVRCFEIIALDDALDVLDLLITDVIKNAKAIGEKKRLRTLKDLDKAALTLAKACMIILDSDCNAENLGEVIFSEVSKSCMSQSVETINELARKPNDNFNEEMIEQYKRVRRFLPHLLKCIEFKASPAGEPVINSIEYLKTLEGKNNLELTNAPLDAGSFD